MNIPEEIVESLVEHYGADAVRSAMDNMQAQAQYEEFVQNNLQPETEAEPWTRKKVLAEAEKCVCGHREQDYGSPEDSFKKIASLWTAYTGVPFHPVDVAVMMALLKVARLASDPHHMDSWVDLAGYAACGGETAAGGN